LEEEGGESTLLARGLELSNQTTHLKRHMAHEQSKVRRIDPTHMLILRYFYFNPFGKLFFSKMDPGNIFHKILF
jgi:hypothetical protein